MDYKKPYFWEYTESIEIYLTEEDKASGKGLQATAGMRRKNIAIAYDKQKYYLLNKDNVVFFEQEKKPYIWRIDSPQFCIKRTLAGYYFVIGEGYCQISRPGKDDDYIYDKWIEAAFDEKGKRFKIVIERYIRETIEEKIDKKYAYGKYPKEMGYGLVCYENVFYHLESLKVAFYIPKHFVIKSIFENGKLELDFVSDRKNYIIKIQDGKMVNMYNIDDIEKTYETYLETNHSQLKSFYPAIFFDNEKNYSKISKIKKILHHTKEEFVKKKLGKYSKYLKDPRCPDSNVRYKETISSRILDIKTFIDGRDLINKEELETINEIYKVLLTYGKGQVPINNRFLYAKSGNNYEYNGCYSQLFNEFFILIFTNGRIRYGSYYFYRFYDYSGKELSKYFYCKLFNPEQNFQTDYIDFNQKVFKFEIFYGDIFSDDYFYYEKFKWGILTIKNGLLKEYFFTDYPSLIRKSYDGTISFPEVYVDFMKFDNHYYSFDGRELPIKYIDVSLKNVIRGVIKRIDHIFFCYFNSHDKYTCEPILSNDEIILPKPECYDSCMKKLSEFNNNRFRNIDFILHMGDYTSSDGDFSLYYIEYLPKARCDIHGVITVDSIPAELKLIGVF